MDKEEFQVIIKDPIFNGKIQENIPKLQKVIPVLIKYVHRTQNNYDKKINP